MEEIKISAVKVGKRYRKDLGDIASLMESIRQVGLLHPIVIDSKGRLIAGERRLVAMKRLGHEFIPAHVVESRSMLRSQHAENTIRKDFDPSEAVAIARALEKQEIAAAKQRQKEHGRTAPGKKGNTGGKSPQVPKREQNLAESRVARAVGMSRPTYRKAKQVVEAAEADPDTYGPIQEEMDRTGKVSTAHRKLQESQSSRKEKTPKEQTDKKKVSVDDLYARWKKYVLPLLSNASFTVKRSFAEKIEGELK